MADTKLENADANQKLPGADTGNASNPPGHDKNREPAKNQLLNEKAEKYIREVANIEDVPDAQEQQDADEIIRKEQRS
jgi:hypothetical protein